MKPKIIFSDVDGTLLNSSHKVLPGTVYAIRELKKKGIPFVIISARSPSGIRPILQENHFTCPMISYSGALILDENENYIGFKGALAENYVQNELKNLGYQPYFWRSGNQAEVDFLIERKGMLIPIEVKSAANTRAKSYRLFCKRYSIRLGFKLSLKNRAVNEEDGTRTVSLPLYLISDLESSCQDQDCQTF